MQEIFNIIEKLRTLSGNAQLEFLAKHKDNETLRDILLYTYDPDKKYKIQETSLEKALETYRRQVRLSEVIIYQNVDKSCWERFRTCLDEFSNKKGVKENEIEEFVKKFYDFYKHDELEYLFKGVLLKTLDLGINVKGLSKIWPDYFSEYPYMGAKILTEDKHKNIKFPCCVQLKDDGLFNNCCVNINKNIVRHVSRQGKDLDIGNFFDNEALSLAKKYNKDMVFTGEIRVLNNTDTIEYIKSKTKKQDVLNELNIIANSGKKYLPRSKSNGLVNDENRPEYLNEYIKYILWDAIPNTDFWNKKYNIRYDFRFSELTTFINNLNLKNIEVVESYIANNFDEIENLYQHVRNRGEEGLVIKNLDTIWKDTKSLMFKIKAVEDCDLKIIDILEGNGRLKGLCGNVTCVSSDGLLKVNVKPRTDDLCEDVWFNKDKYIDKILCLEYNEKVKNKDCNGYTLQHPRWVEVRIDKNIADKCEDIK